MFVKLLCVCFEINTTTAKKHGAYFESEIAENNVFGVYANQFHSDRRGEKLKKNWKLLNKTSIFERYKLANCKRASR